MPIVKFKKKRRNGSSKKINDPECISMSTFKWFNNHAITILPWSPKSPDMNPIEHLWNELDQCLQLCYDCPTSKDDLWNKLQKQWNNIGVEVIHKLVKSMPNKVHALLKVKGGHTKY